MRSEEQTPDLTRCIREFWSDKSLAPLVALVVLLGSALATPAADVATLSADRAAIERVYHSHRTGTKQPFEQAMPQALLEKLVRQDQHKEAVLKRIYKVEVTPAMVAAEVQRIDTTTRAPEVLAEIKHALGDDATRFGRSMARPIIVERELRQRFDNDDTLHAAKRAEADQARSNLLAGKSLKEVHEVTWQLTPRPEGDNSKAGNQRPEATGPPPQTQSVAKSGSYTVEATAQLSQAITSPEPAVPGKEKIFFEDLDPELQKVLRVQLQKPGDVSAVIETLGGFLIFRAKEKTAQTLSVASLSIPKRSYDEWLAQQPTTKP